MINDPFGRASDARGEEARHSYAKGTVLLGANAGQICEIACGKGTVRTWTTINDYVCGPDVVAAAREFIRNEGDSYVVSIGQLLEELEERSGNDGNRFPVSQDKYKLVNLIEALWADSHIDQVRNTGSIEFAWNQKGRWDDGARSPFVQELSRRLERKGIGR
jgi:hypothetical protein